MALLNKLTAIAAPWDTHSRRTTHSVRSVGPERSLFHSYHPESRLETYASGVAHLLAKRGISSTHEDVARAFLAEKRGCGADTLLREPGHSSDMAAHEYFGQNINGVPIANAVANVALKGNRVVSYGASFVDPTATPRLTEDDAIIYAEATVEGTYKNCPVLLEYFAKDSRHVVLTYVVEVQNYEAFIDVHSSEVVTLFHSERMPAIFSGEPVATTATSGNNVLVFKSSVTDGLTPNNYNYVFDPAKEPADNKDVASVNAFYVANMMHDLLYRYGFTESAFNFQYNNNGKRGAQNDQVYLLVQNLGKIVFNHARFFTPANGVNGELRLYIWNKTPPYRDVAFENGLLVHEYTHGLTGRLVGGGTAHCLQSNEARALGEGWSDAVADWVRQTTAESAAADFTLATYVNTKSLRDYPYSTSMTTNPLTYGSLQTRTEIHAASEVWANIWHEIFAAFVAKYCSIGFSNDKNNADGTAGNVVALRLLIDALALQPCNPTFINARDADFDRSDGANNCILWKVFAKRGLGYGATTTKTDVFKLPSGC